MPVVALRALVDADLDALFEIERDKEAARMAAFTAHDPDDRAAFDAHMAKVRALPSVVLRAITVGDRLAGTVSCFVVDGDTEITYWVDRALWGRGIATEAVRLLLAEVPTRPLHARAASDNAGSLRVLEKVGFRGTGTEVAFAPARGAEIEETVLRLD